MATNADALSVLHPESSPLNLKTLIDAHDWAATPLGPQTAWPQSLLTTVDVMLGSGYAMCLAWGPDRTFLYNDAYAAFLGIRHPKALGVRMEEV